MKTEHIKAPTYGLTSDVRNIISLRTVEKKYCKTYYNITCNT